MGALSLLEGCLVEPQLQYIKATWFARAHGPVEVPGRGVGSGVSACVWSVQSVAHIVWRVLEDVGSM